jgi:hypothetical protein
MRKNKELPCGMEILPALLPMMRRHTETKGFYNTDDLKASAAQIYSVTGPEDLKTLNNYVDWLTARMTIKGLHTGGNKKYTLNPKMIQVAEQSATAINGMVSLFAA